MTFIVCIFIFLINMFLICLHISFSDNHIKGTFEEPAAYMIMQNNKNKYFWQKLDDSASATESAASTKKHSSLEHLI